MSSVRQDVHTWALANGWQHSGRSPYLFQTREDVRYRLQIGDGVLREQVWVARDYAPRVKGYWKNVSSCPWGAVSVVDGQLVRGKNNVRPFGMATQ